MAQFSVGFQHYDMKITSHGKYGLKNSNLTPGMNILGQVYHVKWNTGKKVEKVEYLQRM